MRPNLGVRTLDLCSQLFGLPRLAPPAFPPARFRPAFTSLSQRLELAPESRAVAGLPPRSVSTPANRAGHELRCRLVGEYRRRLDVLDATLRSLDETWARDTLVRVLLAEQSVDAWAAHLRSLDGRMPVAEPPCDLHVVGEEVLELIASTTSRLARSSPREHPSSPPIIPRRSR